MPIIKISMYPGRSKSQKDEFAKIVSQAAINILNAKKRDVIIVFEENDKNNWYFHTD
ncbi:MAG: tautomerase family protein [Nitrosopumilaceae archaeon]|nr:tautomerase family protein [Nitrosopumilaceae archaeon]